MKKRNRKIVASKTLLLIALVFGGISSLSIETATADDLIGKSTTLCMQWEIKAKCKCNYWSGNPDNPNNNQTVHDDYTVYACATSDRNAISEGNADCFDYCDKETPETKEFWSSSFTGPSATAQKPCHDQSLCDDDNDDADTKPLQFEPDLNHGQSSSDSYSQRY